LAPLGSGCGNSVAAPAPVPVAPKPMLNARVGAPPVAVTHPFPVSGPLALDDVAAALGAAACDFAVRCFAAAETLFVTPDGCTPLVAQRYQESWVAPLRAAVDAGRASYDPAKMAACLLWLDGRDCGEEDGAGLCTGVYAGTVSTGGSGTDVCPVGEECPLSFSDRSRNDSLCVAVPAPGEPCTLDLVPGSPWLHCGPSAFCDASSTCINVGLIDDPCEFDGDCASGGCNNGRCGPTPVCKSSADQGNFF